MGEEEEEEEEEEDGGEGEEGCTDTSSCPVIQRGMCCKVMGRNV